MSEITQKKPVYTNICVGGPLHGTQHHENDEVDFFEAVKKVELPKLDIGDINGASRKIDKIRYKRMQIRNPDRVYYYWAFDKLNDTDGRTLLLGFVLDLMTKMQGG